MFKHYLQSIIIILMQCSFNTIIIMISIQRKLLYYILMHNFIVLSAVFVDLLLHRKTSCPEDLALVQNDTLCLVIPFYKLTLNSRNCKSLLISRMRLPTGSPTLYVNGSVLERVFSYKKIILGYHNLFF